MPLPQTIQHMLGQLNRPLRNASALTKAFEAPPAQWSALPAYYMRHLKSVFSDPGKMRMAMTDVTPLSLLGMLTAGPSLVAALKLQPHRKAQAIAGAIGNMLGGQVMQRTGLLGGLLGSVAGEGLGRAAGATLFPSRKPTNVLADVALNRIDKVRSVNQKIDDLLGGVQDKLGFEIGVNGPRVPDITTTESDIGGAPQMLQTRPDEQYHQRNVADRGKTRPEDYSFLRLLDALRTPEEKDPYQQWLQGMDVFPSQWDKDAPSSSGITGAERKPLPDKKIQELQ